MTVHLELMDYDDKNKSSQETKGYEENSLIGRHRVRAGYRHELWFLAVGACRRKQFYFKLILL